MMRLDLPELEDSPGCPRWIRDAMTAYLQTIIEDTGPYSVTLPIITDLLDGVDSPRVTDVASGAGGPWPALLPELRKTFPELTVELTDAFPNHAAARRLCGHPGLLYSPDPVSALAPIDRPADLRTCFTALHHFSPEEVKSILLEAQWSGTPFLAAEASHRSIRGVVMSLFIPLLVLVFMPRVRPRRLLPLLLTYLPPILPLLIWWDGFASTLKSYSRTELEAIAAEIAVDGYDWQVLERAIPLAPIPILCVVGRPVGA